MDSTPKRTRHNRVHMTIDGVTFTEAYITILESSVDTA